MPPTTSPTADREYPGFDPDFNVEAFASRFMLVARFLSEPGFKDEMQQFLRVVDAAHNVGWFLDPTKYHDMLVRKGNVDDLARLVKLALPLSEAVQEFIAEFADEGAGAAGG